MLFSFPAPQAVTLKFAMTWETAADGLSRFSGGRGQNPCSVSARNSIRRKSPFPRLLTLACAVPARLPESPLQTLPGKNSHARSLQRRHRGRAAHRHFGWAACSLLHFMTCAQNENVCALESIPLNPVCCQEDSYEPQDGGVAEGAGSLEGLTPAYFFACTMRCSQRSIRE